MQILALLHLIPNPPHGGEQRVHHLLEAFADCAELAVVGLPRAIDQTESWPLSERFRGNTQFFNRTPIDSSTNQLLKQFPSADRWPRRVQNDYSAQLWNYLDQLDLKNTSLIFAGSLGMLPYAVVLKAKWPHIQIIVDFDYVDPLYGLRTISWKSKSFFSKQGYWSLRHLYELFRFCRRWLPTCEQVWVCSKPDLQWTNRWLGVKKNHLEVVPNGIECLKFAQIKTSSASRVLMTGSLMEGANSVGAIWFTENVWGKIRESIPDAEFWLVGRNPCDAVLDLPKRYSGITVISNVPDMRDYTKQAAVAIAPIRFGTGTRLKILEAAACGVPVVSTSVGAEGLAFTPGRDYLQADTPSDFANACIRLLEDSDLSQAIGEAGRAAVQQYDWGQIRKQIADLVLQTNLA